MNPADLIGMIVGFFLTLITFSYIFKDNVLFRLVMHIFIGLAAGYAAIMAWYNVIWPQLVVPLVSGTLQEYIWMVIPLVLGFLLMTRIIPSIAGWGKPTLAFLVGIGAATVVGGAVLGTLLPQIRGLINLFDQQYLEQSAGNYWNQMVNSTVILVGTITTLTYFQFQAKSRLGQPVKRAAWIESISWIGKIFIAITLGVLFAGVYSAGMAAFVERMNSLVEVVLAFLQP